MTKRVLSVIPARGGSKGLPRKNIIDLKGKPLIAWTIESSLKSKYISKTVVSSDDEEILDISKNYNAQTIKRPEEFSNDEASSECVVFHALQYLKKEDFEFDYVVLLQPTSPLRDEKDIDMAFEKLFEKEASALISVTLYDNKILKAFMLNSDGFMQGVSNNSFPFQRRQDLPKTYLSNGAIYIIEVEEFLERDSFYTDKTVSFEMSKEKSFDVDTIEDLKHIERQLDEKN
ncbi:acylneuraminate cytidylyltransferase family protein [Arcobacter peruensis]|uniref:acylneuraminate cytidylyltransferase family protein n=1 Tax=Arcobacter peruensis TaxID=2320140 RepID=UPI000F092EA1|nr:acylneuraminate cytidylyltransferase family protein [Arcobacter peruensis]